MRNKAIWILAGAAIVLIAILGLQALDQGVNPQAVARAQAFLNPADRGKEILNFIHLDKTYRSHEYLETMAYDYGRFDLVYKFHWSDLENAPDYTDVTFHCDRTGTVESVSTGDTTAKISQPFAAANLTINVVGNLVFTALKDELTEGDQREVKQLIDRADAKALLEWELRFEQGKRA